MSPTEHHVARLEYEATLSSGIIVAAVLIATLVSGAAVGAAFQANRERAEALERLDACACWSPSEITR